MISLWLKIKRIFQYKYSSEIREMEKSMSEDKTILHECYDRALLLLTDMLEQQKDMPADKVTAIAMAILNISKQREYSKSIIGVELEDMQAKKKPVEEKGKGFYE